MAPTLCVDAFCFPPDTVAFKSFHLLRASINSAGHPRGQTGGEWKGLGIGYDPDSEGKNNCEEMPTPWCLT